MKTAQEKSGTEKSAEPAAHPQARTGVKTAQDKPGAAKAAEPAAHPPARTEVKTAQEKSGTEKSAEPAAYPQARTGVKTAQDKPGAEENTGILRTVPREAGNETRSELGKPGAEPSREEVRSDPSSRPRGPATFDTAERRSQEEESRKLAGEEEARRQAARAMTSPLPSDTIRGDQGVQGVQGVQSAGEARERKESIQQATRALSGEEKRAVERALNNPRIDTDLLKDLTRDGFGIYRVDEKDRRLQDGQGKSREGFYNYDDNRIRISETAFSRPELLNKVLADELGHRIDDRLRTSPETSEKWSRMMDRYFTQERARPQLDQNSRKNVGEFSSEVISAYLRGGPEEAQLRRAYPELHRVLRETVGQSDRSDLTTRPTLMSRFLGSERVQQAQVQRNQLTGQYFSDSVQAPMASPSRASAAPPQPAAVRAPESPPSARAEQPAPPPPPASPLSSPVRATPQPPTSSHPTPAVSRAAGAEPPSPQNQPQPVQTGSSGGGVSSGRSGATSLPFSESLRPPGHPQVLGLAQQQLASDLSLLQSPALLEMQALGAQLGSLEGIPETLKSLENLRALGAGLEGVPETLQGLGQMGQVLDRVRQLPTSLNDPRQRPELRGMLDQLPSLSQRLGGLRTLAERGPELKSRMSELDSLGPARRPLASDPTLPARFERLSQDWTSGRRPGSERLPEQNAGGTPERLQEQLERAPLQAARASRIGVLQRLALPAARGLEQVSRQAEGLQRLQQWTRDPQPLQQGLTRLEGLTEGQQRESLRPLRSALAPFVSETSGRQGLQQAGEVLPQLQGPQGRTRLASARRLTQETPPGTSPAAELRRPGLAEAFQQVSEQLGQVRESRRANEAFLKVNPQLTPPAEWDLSASLADILQTAEAAHRPRKLFGISLGSGAPRTAPGAAVAGVTGAPPSPAPAVRPREVMSRARLEAYRDTHETMRQQLQGRGKADHPWALVYHSRDAEGARGLADTLESTVARGGSSRFQGWLRQMTETPDASVALSAILANVSQVTPERMVGTLLLTSDGEGGREAVGQAFLRMSAEVDGSIRLAHFLDQSTRHPLAARGVAELFETLSEPKGDDWSGSRQLAQTFLGMSETVGGARRLGQALENLGEVEGGHRLVGKTLHRLSRTPEGARATLESLQNVAHDKDGARQIGGVLARAARSRDGARDVLEAFQRMASDRGGKEELGRFFVQLSESGQGSKLLANLSLDGHNAAPLAQLFEQLNQSTESRELLGYALRQMESSPRERSQCEVFQGRVASCEALRNAYEVAVGERETSPSAPARASFAEAPQASLLPFGSVGLESSEARTWVVELQKFREDYKLESSSPDWLPRSQPGEGPEGAPQFRPADVYSEETLRQARICGECGCRTSAQGWCPRCLVKEQRRSS